MVTDGRGAVTTFTYENASGTPKRPLVTGIAWTVPGGSGITDPSDVSFTYDNAGNRLTMTDGLGSVAYTYNSLSQMTDETRDFTDSLADSPITGGKFKLEYSYHIGGQLKSYKDPWDEEIAQANDKTGRLSSVTGTSFGGVTNYANNAAYRAWGALKHLEFGSLRQAEVTYNSRLLADTFEINQIGNTSIKTFDKEYEYYADGRTSLIDEDVEYGDRYDRFFTFDHMGRVKSAKSGIEAHGETETDLDQLPYRQSYSYNAFGDIVERDSTMWDYEGDWDFAYTYANRRAAYSTYDADGRQTIDPRTHVDGNAIYFEFDAAGQMWKTSRYYDAYETLVSRDGNGQETKRAQRVYDPEEEEWGDWESSFFVNSSVLGRTVSETTATGAKKTTFVYGDGVLIAKQFIDDEDSESVAWKYSDASGLSTRSNLLPHYGGFTNEELDGLGNNVGANPSLSSPSQRHNPTSPNDSMVLDPMIGDCEYNGVLGPCSFLSNLERGSSFFAYANDLPFEAMSQISNSRDSIANQISRNINGALGANSAFISIREGFSDTSEPPQADQEASARLNNLQSTAPLPSDISARVKARLDSGDCRKTITSLLKELGKIGDLESDNLETLLANVLGSGGGGITLAELNGDAKDKAKLIEKMRSGKGAYVRFGTNDQIKGKQRILVQTLPLAPGATTPIADYQERYISTILHELIHLARDGDGVFSHKNILKAINRIDSQFSSRGNEESDEDAISQFINKHCTGIGRKK